MWQVWKVLSLRNLGAGGVGWDVAPAVFFLDNHLTDSSRHWAPLMGPDPQLTGDLAQDPPTSARVASL